MLNIGYLEDRKNQKSKMTSAHRIESIAVGKNELKLSSQPTFFRMKGLVFGHEWTVTLI